MRTRETVAYEWLKRFGPMAAFEFNEKERTGYSENTLATGLSNLAREGKITSTYKPGTRYKVWRVVGQVEMFAPLGIEAFR